MLGLKRNTVMLCPHEKAWEDNAAETIRALKEILGDAVYAAHVGSTSIVHIAAKPIIDIAVAVRELSDVEPYFDALGAAGFEHIPKNDDETQVFFSRGEGDLRTHYIHVVRADSPEWENYNNFRDYCNGRPDVAREYESLKRGLAEKYPTDRESYTQGKAEFITSALRKARSWVYLGKTLTAKIDRPIGSRHPGHGFTYPVNYGYIEGIKGGDGEWQDCYILGVDESLTEFTGLMAAVIYRIDDAEDKWALCPPDYKPDQAYIAEQTEFVERYYTTEIEHLYHASCGMIVYRFRGGEPEFLILYQTRSRTYTVPKGHREAYETELQTAKREVLEEIGVSLEPTEDFYTKITYDIPPIYEKTVALYLCEYAGEVTLRQGEIARGNWYTLPECAALLTPQLYSALSEARDYIISKRWKK